MQKTSPSKTILSTGQRISRKYRRAHLRRLQRKEFHKLRKVIPSVAEQDEASKVSIVQEATKYIQELHNAVSDKLKHFGFDVPPSDHQTLLKVLQLIVPTTITDYSHFQITGQPAPLHHMNFITPPSQSNPSQPQEIVHQKSLRHLRL